MTISIMSYSPEDLVVVVAGKKIEGFSEEFLQESPQGFCLSLTAGTPSRGILLALCNKIADVEVVVPVQDVYGNRISQLDIKGKYLVSRIGLKMGMGFPVEIFQFSKQGSYK